jgi:hypothetical protein
MIRRLVTIAVAVLALAVATPAAGGAVSPACRTADLSIHQLFFSGATGHVLHVFRVRNRSAQTCHTFGFFGVQLIGRHGHNRHTRAQHVTHDFFGVQHKRRVTIKPGRAASFRISTTTGPGFHCVGADRVALIAPDDTVATTVKAEFNACQHGRVEVGPVQRGDGARPRH